MTNEQRAGLIAFANVLIPFLVLVGVITWDEKTIAAFVAVISVGVTTLGLFWARKDAKQAQQAIEVAKAEGATNG